MLYFNGRTVMGLIKRAEGNLPTVEGEVRIGGMSGRLRQRSISLLRLTAAAKRKMQPKIRTGSHSSLQRCILT